MSNGARHALGALIGVVLTPLIVAALLYGAYQLHRSTARVAATFGGEAGSERWVGAAIVLGTAVLVALAVAPRVSPLASLIPGAVLTAVGGVWIVDPGWMMQQELVGDVLPDELQLPFLGIVGPYGLFLLLGLLLLAASVFPSRWTGRAAVAPRPVGPPAGPGGPPPMPGAGAPHRPQERPEPFAPSFSQPPAQQGPPQPQPPGRPQTPPSGAVPFGREDERPDPFRDQGEGGEWTRMYGDDDLRGR